MKLALRHVIALLVAAGLALSSAAAEEVVLAGKIACAKCTPKKAGAKDCQNVLIVTDKEGRDVEYYIAKNAVTVKHGDVCTSTKRVTLAGAVSEKDGRKWVAATSIEDQQTR